MKQGFTNSYDKEFLLETMMGPNAMRVAEELTDYMDIQEGQRVLDLGCGMGISSILAAGKHGAKVFAADLWISPSDNYERFKREGFESDIIPISVDATIGLPFAHGYFDHLISIDAYHYFGNNETMLPSLIPFVKKGGSVGIAVPGLKKEFTNGIPEELRPFLPDDANFYTLAYWENIFNKAEGVTVTVAREMDVLKEAWDEWLLSDNPYAVGDRDMMKAENGKYYNLVQVVAKVD